MTTYLSKIIRLGQRAVKDYNLHHFNNCQHEHRATLKPRDEYALRPRMPGAGRSMRDACRIIYVAQD